MVDEDGNEVAFDQTQEGFDYEGIEELAKYRNEQNRGSSNSIHASLPNPQYSADALIDESPWQIVESGISGLRQRNEAISYQGTDDILLITSLSLSRPSAKDVKTQLYENWFTLISCKAVNSIRECEKMKEIDLYVASSLAYEECYGSLPLEDVCQRRILYAFPNFSWPEDFQSYVDSTYKNKKVDSKSKLLKSYGQDPKWSCIYFGYIVWGAFEESKKDIVKYFNPKFKSNGRLDSGVTPKEHLDNL
jgi:hypothetical protein